MTDSDRLIGRTTAICGSGGTGGTDSVYSACASSDDCYAQADFSFYCVQWVDFHTKAHSKDTTRQKCIDTFF